MIAQLKERQIRNYLHAAVFNMPQWHIQIIHHSILPVSSFGNRISHNFELWSCAFATSRLCSTTWRDHNHKHFNSSVCLCCDHRDSISQLTPNNNNNNNSIATRSQHSAFSFQLSNNFQLRSRFANAIIFYKIKNTKIKIDQLFTCKN